VAAATITASSIASMPTAAVTARPDPAVADTTTRAIRAANRSRSPALR
jgi:hypothetical protein